MVCQNSFRAVHQISQNLAALAFGKIVINRFSRNIMGRSTDGLQSFLMAL